MEIAQFSLINPSAETGSAAEEIQRRLAHVLIKEGYFQIVAQFQPKVLSGQHVVVTAGPTFEALDPIRGITNHSSGKMGFAIARAARDAGAEHKRFEQ